MSSGALDTLLKKAIGFQMPCDHFSDDTPTATANSLTGTFSGGNGGRLPVLVTHLHL